MSMLCLSQDSIQQNDILKTVLMGRKLEFLLSYVHLS